MIVAVSGRTAIAATITSLATVPAGLPITRDPESAFAELLDRKAIGLDAGLIETPTVAQPVEPGTPVHDMVVLAEPDSVLDAPRTCVVLPLDDWLQRCV